MDDEERYQEENTARLIRASFGGEARPSPATREEAYRRLVSQLRARPAVVDFPDRVLGLLVGVLAMVAAWLAMQIVAGVPTSASPMLLVATCLLMVNLALVPVAGILIVLRRRYV